MKKKTDEELGILLTREMQSMMFNEKLTAEQRVSIFCSIVSGEDVDNPLLSAFAESLKTGFIHANEARKASIYSKRERERERLRNQRQSSAINANQRQSSATAIYGNGNGNGKGNNPLPPKGGKGGKVSADVGKGGNSAKDSRAQDGRCVWCDGEGICRDPKGNGTGAKCCNCEDKTSAEDWACCFADEICGWYPYKVNLDGLKKMLLSKVKKNLARAVVDGIAAWRESGAWDEERFVPPDIVKWIKLERFLDEPPQKKSTAAREDGDRALAAPSSDATMRMIASDGMDDGM